MGTGDTEPGQKLLLSFLSKLASSDIQVDMEGARIATCGTCPDHYQVRDKLIIGEVGTMEQSAQIPGTANRIIRV